MNDAEIIRYVNDFGLRCTVCNGSITIDDMRNGKTSFTHNLPIPGEKVPSNETRCKFFETGINTLIASYKNNQISLSDFREGLVDLNRDKVST